MFFLTVVSASKVIDPVSPYSRMHSDPKKGGTTRYNNPEFDKLWDAANVELDREKRRSLFEQMNALFHDDPPGIPLWTFFSTIGVSKNISDVKLAGNGLVLYEGMTSKRKV